MHRVWGLFLHFGEVGVHHVVVVVALGGTGAGVGARTGLLGTAVGGLLLVELFGQLVGSLGQLFGGSLDGGGVIAFHGLAQGGDLAFHVALHSGVHLVAQIVQGLFGAVDQAVGVVAGLDGLLLLLVFAGVGFSFTHQALDVFFGQTGRGLDLDGLFLAGAHILGGHVDDTVGVDIEGHFDLRHATGCRRDTGQVEAGHGHVVGRHGTFALQHVDGHGGLVVSGRGEHVALAGGDGGVAVDQLGEHAAHGLDTQGQGRHVQQQHVLHVTGQDAALDGGAHGHHFVGVHGTVGILAEELAHLLLHQGHTGHAADQDDFVVTLLFVDEPASATNAITVSFAQGETGAGAWLATQTFFAIDENGEPIGEKGGETIDFPIWDDAEGNARGEHKDVHGWLYQPLVGDKLGMSVVLDPSRGLIGGRNLGDAQAVCRDFASGTNRLYLVWTLIPASTVSAADPTGGSATSATTNFFKQWNRASWLGATPSIGTGLTTSLTTIRRNLAGKYDPTGTQSYCVDAGVVPLEFIGFRDPDLVVSEDAADGGILETEPDYTDEAFLANARLAFRTMTAEHFAAGGFDQSGFADGLAPFTQTIDMTDETVWQNGAVLRFAIVVARDDTVYDAQGIANFTSDGFEGYCPWYVPDAQANINAHAEARRTNPNEEATSPYAWIYGIAPDGVWLNEFRPTRRNANGKDLLSFGIELAMEASPIAVMHGTEGETPDYKDPATVTLSGNNYYLRPKHSLDGWSIAVKVAPLPLTTDPLDVPLAWTNVTTNIELKGWVPYRRLFPNAADPAVYDTDYYVIGDTRIGSNYPHGFFQNISSSETPNFISYPYEESSKNGFCWYPAPDPLALANIPEAARTFTDVYANGTLYAIQLVRDNGVVADEVLLCDYRADASVSIVEACLQHAVTIENASHTVSTVVRSMPVSRLSDTVESAEVAYSNMLVACIDHTDANNPRDLGTSWSYDSSSTHRNTFFGANGGWWLGNWELVQPRTAFRLSASDAGRILALSAQIVGGGTSGLLSLVHNGTDSATGRAVSFVGAPGDRYALSVAQPWNEEWFRLSSITKNGQPLEAQAKRLTTFSVADAGTLSADASFAIDSGLLDRDTDYVLTLVYSPAAARLDASGALESEDDGFLEWVLQNDPDAILKQTQEDGVTASEKYWLGFDSAIEVADVNLNFTGIGTYAEGDEALAAAEGAEPLEGAEGGKTVPTVSIAFTNKGEPITEIRGDGALLLLGKVSLDDPEWRYVKRLYPNDLNGDRVLILSDTDCNFFRAVLLSVKDAEATGR